MKRVARQGPELGACYATQFVAKLRHPVRFMYREAPKNEHDSGWRFFAGVETQAYVDDPSNSAIYDVRTIAEIDPDIIPHLVTPWPCAFERESADDGFVVSEFDFEPEE